MSRDVMEQLIKLIADSIRVLRTRDGLPVTEELCQERARNLATVLVVNYELRELPGPYTVDFADPRISPPASRWSKTSELAELYERGKPQGHGETCRCDGCDNFNRSVTTNEGRKS